MFRRFAASAAMILASAAATSALADPFAITHVGTQSESDFPNIRDGESYEVTLVLDNGSATAVGQTWSDANIKCVVWKFNDARNVAFAQDTSGTPPLADDSAQTNGTGALASMFSQVIVFGVSSNYALSSGNGMTPGFAWYANGVNGIFYDDNQARGVSDSSGGVPMAASDWSDPQPFAGNCLEQADVAAAPQPASVPTLSEWAMIALTAMLAGMAAVMAKRRRRV